jgi:hypothetical protein
MIRPFLCDLLHKKAASSVINLVWPNAGLESPSEEAVIRLAPGPHHRAIQPLQDKIESQQR